MPDKFIEVNNLSDRNRTLIAVSQIVLIESLRQGTIIRCVTGRGVESSEPYDIIKKKIADA